MNKPIVVKTFKFVIAFIVLVFIMITSSNNIIQHAYASEVDIFLNLKWSGTASGRDENQNSIFRNYQFILDNIDENGKFEGTCKIFLSNSNLFGSYIFSGNLNFDTYHIVFQGTKWIEEPFSSTSFLKFDGYVNKNNYHISGKTSLPSFEGTFNFSAIYIGGEHSIFGIDSFNYSSNYYNHDLAIQNAEYAMLAYDNSSFYNEQYYSLSSRWGFPVYLHSHLYGDKWKDVNVYNYADDNEDNCSFTITHKTVLKNGVEEELTLIVIRGTDSVEWFGNMNVTGEKYNSTLLDHNSFYLASIDIKDTLFNYLNIYGIENTNIMITGHSRGAAVGNLLAKYLTDLSGVSNQILDVYAYTFATPNVSLKADVNGNSIENKKEYNNIFNFCFKDDFVPQVPLNTEYGWNYEKYGNTFEIIAENITNSRFINNENAYTNLSSNKNFSFNYQGTNNLLNYVGDNWKNVNDYYNKKYNYLSLYGYFHDFIAPTQTKSANSFLGTLGVLLEVDPHSKYSNISSFFINNSKFNSSINDTHQMYTYYNALINNCFNISENSIQFGQINPLYLNSTNEIVEIDIEECNEWDINKLLSITSQYSNSKYLNWSTTLSPLYWEGVTWKKINNTYYLEEVNIPNYSLNGVIDLSNCIELKSIICDANDITELNLDNCNNLQNISFNNCSVIDLKINNSNSIKKLLCINNFLNVTKYENIFFELKLNNNAIIDYSNQNVNNNDSNIFNYDEYNELLNFNKDNNNIFEWNINNIGEWSEIEWKLMDDSEYHIISINLDNSNSSGTLNLYKFNYLEEFSCAESDIEIIILPKSINQIKYNSFYHCTNLKELYIYNPKCLIDFNAFYYTSSEFTIYSYYDSYVKLYALANNLNFINIGDINTDGDITILDLLLLKQHIFNGHKIKNNKLADVNNDNTINIFDVIILKSYILQ